MLIEPTSVEAMVLLDQISAFSEKTATENPAQQSQALKDRGNEAMKNEAFEEAIALYSDAIRLDPTGVVSYNNRAQAYLKLSRFADSESDASRVIAMCGPTDKSSSNFKKALFRRAIARRSMGGGSLVSAVSDLASLCALEPDNKSVQMEYSRTEQLLKEEQSRIKSNQNAAAVAPRASTVSSSPSSFEMKERSTTKRTFAPPPPPPGFSPLSTLDSSPSSPSPPLPSPASLPSVSKKSRSPATATSSSKMPVVPTEPPKTTYELERNWRALKSYPDLFAEYLSCFKKSTYKRVFKESISPELMGSLFVALRDHAESNQIVATLEGIAQGNSFDMTLALLPEEDASILRAVFAKLAATANDETALNALRAVYKM